MRLLDKITVGISEHEYKLFVNLSKSVYLRMATSNVSEDSDRVIIIKNLKMLFIIKPKRHVVG